MPNRVYDLLTELSTPTLRTVQDTSLLLNELKDRLERGETLEHFQSSVLDTYYASFIKEDISCVLTVFNNSSRCSKESKYCINGIFSSS